MKPKSLQLTDYPILVKWHKNRSRIVWLLILSGLFAIGYWYHHFNPLPSDEYMIAHFNAHRPAFEALVKSYRTYPDESSHPYTDWLNKPETQQLMAETGIGYINNGHMLWLPAPYSIAAAEKERQLRKNVDLNISRRYGTLNLRMEDMNQFAKPTLSYGTIFKSYIYVPQPPMIENGRIMAPWDYHNNKLETSSPLSRVVPSLNNFRKDWEKGDCLWRQIDPQWFLEMCRSN